MASPNQWSSGMGGTGPATATATPVILSAKAWFVSSVIGSDATGTGEPERPYATFDKLLTAAVTDGDVVNLGAGHDEVLPGETIVTNGMRIIGWGSGSSLPKFRTAGGVMIDVTAIGVVFENLYFPASTGASTCRIRCAQAGIQVLNCYFECGASDTGNTVKLDAGAHHARIEGTSFVSTASRPAIGLGITGACHDVEVVDTVFDGSSFGWTDYAFKAAGAVTRLVRRNISLLNYSDAIVATGSVYQSFGTNYSANAPGKEVWTA